MITSKKKQKKKIENNVQRTCVVTKKVFLVKQLIRFNFNRKTKDITVDFQKVLKGRGAYVLNRFHEIEMLFEKRLLNRSFHTKFDNKTYEKLREEVLTCLKNALLT